jgi:hypothetical protein
MLAVQRCRLSTPPRRQASSGACAAWNGVAPVPADQALRHTQFSNNTIDAGAATGGAWLEVSRDLRVTYAAFGHGSPEAYRIGFSTVRSEAARRSLLFSASNSFSRRKCRPSVHQILVATGSRLPPSHHASEPRPPPACPATSPPLSAAAWQQSSQAYVSFSASSGAANAM